MKFFLKHNIDELVYHDISARNFGASDIQDKYLYHFLLSNNYNYDTNFIKKIILILYVHILNSYLYLYYQINFYLSLSLILNLNFKTNLGFQNKFHC